METGKIFVGCASNEAYSLPLGVMLHSLCRHMEHPENLKVFLVDGGISDRSKSRIRRIVNGFGSAIEFLKPLQIEIERISYLTQEAAYRLMFPSLLPNVDRLIYLDCDLLVFADLMPLWNCEFDLLGASLDLLTPRLSDQVSNHEQFVSHAVSPAFNSGVLIMNLAALRSSKTMKECFSLLTGPSHKEMNFMDQSVLNIVFHRDRTWIPLQWNFPSSHLKIPFDELEEERLEALSSTGEDYLKAQTHFKILHFMGRIKPWMPSCELSKTRTFHRELNASLWFDSKFEQFIWHFRFRCARVLYKCANFKFTRLDLERWYWRRKMAFKRNLGLINE